MLLCAVFPLVDVRSFLDADTGRLAPLTSLRHLPLFGAIQKARRRLVPGSPAEGVVCPSSHVFRFAGPQHLALRCVFRELCPNDEIVLRFEVGLGSRAPLKSNESPQSLVQAWCERSVALRTTKGAQVLEPMYAGRFLARLYAQATTRTKERRRIEAFWLSPGDPAFFIQWSKGEFSPENIPSMENVDAELRLAVLPFQWAGRAAKIFLLESGQGPEALRRASLLRAKIAHLHSAREGVKTVLSHIASSYLAFQPKPKEPSPAFQALDRYLNTAIRQIERSARRLPACVSAPLGQNAKDNHYRRVFMAPALDMAMREAGHLFNVRHKSVEWYRKELDEPPVPRSAKELPQTPMLNPPTSRALPRSNDGWERAIATDHLPETQLNMRALLSPVGITSVEPEQEVTFLMELKRDRGTLPSPPPAGAAHDLQATLGAGVESLDLVVTVSSEHFRQIPGQNWLQTFKIDRSGQDFPPWVFRARASGERPFYQLDLSFYLGGAYQRSLSLKIPRSGSQQPSSGSQAGLSLDFEALARRKGARLVLSIASDGHLHRLHWIDTKTMQFGDDEISVNTDLYFTDLANDRAQPYEVLRRRFRSFIWELPPPLLKLLQSPDFSGQPISVTSPTPIFPIELLPLEGNRPLLGMDRPVFRWIKDIEPPSPDEISFGEMTCIRPNYFSKQSPLPDAIEEQAALQKRFPLRHIETMEQLESLINEGHARLIHFAGHAVDSPPKLFLGDDDPVSPEIFWDTPLMKDQPFVFINGCKAGMARPGQPAARANMMRILLSSRFSGAVAPLIEVYSPAAKKAAEAFYEAIINNQSVGEATMSVRRLALSDPEHAATYISYLSFALPGLKLRFSGTTPSSPTPPISG